MFCTWNFAIAMFVLLSTIAFTGSFGWASYTVDHSRYQKKDTPSVPVFLWTLGGLAFPPVLTLAPRVL